MQPTIGVLTCRRPKRANYLLSTVAQIDAQGGGAVARKVVFVDGDDGFAEEIRPALPSTWSVVPLGKNAFSAGAAAYKRGLAYLAEFKRDVLMFEDDLDFSRNAVARMIATPVPLNAGLLTFFDMKEFSAETTPGIYCLRPSRDPIHCRTRPQIEAFLGLWGSQCFRYPADMVSWLVAQDWTKTALWPHGQDLVVGNMVEQHPTRHRIAVHLPCLVEHVGQISAYTPFGLEGRTATQFIGRDADALALPHFPPVTL